MTAITTAVFDCNTRKLTKEEHDSEDWEWYNRRIGSRIFSSVHRAFGGRDFCVTLDDDGCNNSSSFTSVWIRDDEIIEVLVGTLIFLHVGEEGEDVSITDEDFEILEKCIKPHLIYEKIMEHNMDFKE